MDLRIDFQKLARAKSCGASIDESTHPNLLSKREADALIDLVVDNSVLLKSIMVVRTDKCKGEIPRLDLGIVSEGANARTCAVERKPTDSYITYDMVKYRSAVSISQDFLDCNVYGSNIQESVIGMFRKQISNDMEAASIEGDESLPVGDFQSDYNNLMGVNDGFIALAKCCAPSCQVIDAQGAGPSPKLFMAARSRLPARYRRDRNNYRFIIGPQIKDWYDWYWATRQTVGGDDALRNASGNPIFGNAMFEVPIWPENLPYGSNGVDTTTILYTPLDNMINFVQREMSLEWERRIRCDDYQGTMYWRADFAFKNPDAVVVIKNIDPCASPWDGCGESCDPARTHIPGESCD